MQRPIAERVIKLIGPCCLFFEMRFVPCDDSEVQRHCPSQAKVETMLQDTLRVSVFAGESEGGPTASSYRETFTFIVARYAHQYIIVVHLGENPTIFILHCSKLYWLPCGSPIRSTLIRHINAKPLFPACLLQRQIRAS